MSRKPILMQDYLTSATGSIATDNKSWIEHILMGSPNKIKIQTKLWIGLIEGREYPKLNQNRC